MYQISAFLIFLALIAQRLGTTGTCTQGADGPFMTGAVLSSPILLIVSSLLFVSWRRNSPKRKTLVTPFQVFSLIALSGVAVWLVTLNYPIWNETLVAGGSPCGPDHASAVDSNNAKTRAVLIGLIYGVWPSAVALASMILLVSSIRRFKSLPNGPRGDQP